MRSRAWPWLLIVLQVTLLTFGCATRHHRDPYYSRESIHHDSFPETTSRDPWDGPVTYGRY